MIRRSLGALCAACFCCGALQTRAQPPHYRLREISFDMWCQETRHFPPARCDKRLPEDDAAFQAYVDTIERYETQKLNTQARDRHIEQMIDRADPVDHPPRQP